MEAGMLAFKGFADQVNWAGEQSAFLRLGFLDGHMDSISAGSGLPVDQIRFIIVLFGSFPLSFLHWKLPSTTLRHVYSLVMGLIYVQFLYGNGWIHSVLSSTITYILLWVAPRSHVHLIVFAFAMGYMLLVHAYNQYFFYLNWAMDSTGTQMVLTMKLTAIAFNLHDGTAAKGLLAKVTAKYEADKDNKKLAFEKKVLEERAKRQVEAPPPVLEYFAWIYLYSAVITGPAFEFVEYRDSTNRDKFKFASSTGDIEFIEPPGRIKHSLITLGSGIVCLVAYLGLSAILPSSLLTANHSIVSVEGPVTSTTSPSMAMPLPITMFMYFLILEGTRCKYYFAWKIAEACCIAAGFGFAGKDQKSAVWNGVENIDITGFEFPSTISAASRAWNKRTQQWLEMYTYKRTGRSIQLFATYLVSAVWHGFYPGYYNTFLYIALLTAVERQIKEKISPLLADRDGKAPAWYDHICRVTVTFGANYAAMSFVTLSVDKTWTAYKSLFFVGHIGPLLLFIILKLLPSPKKKSA